MHTFKWYILPRHEQRNYNMLLHYVQHPRAIYIAGIKPLNMETCLAVSGQSTRQMFIDSPNFHSLFFLSQLCVDIEGPLLIGDAVELIGGVEWPYIWTIWHTMHM